MHLYREMLKDVVTHAKLDVEIFNFPSVDCTSSKLHASLIWNTTGHINHFIVSTWDKSIPHCVQMVNIHFSQSVCQTF